MTLLITGGCGFIGSNFIRCWLKKHPRDKIINLDKLTYAGHLSSAKDFSSNKNYKFVKGDICDPQVVDKVMVGIDFMVHFAAESHVDRSILKPAEFVKTNVLGTQVLLQAALNHQIKRFHHVSTDEVFGSLPLESKEKFNEMTIYNPHSPYSASKAGSDHLVRSYFATFGLPITITNYSNNYGPYQDPEKFLPRMITNLIDGQKVPIYGDGKYVRDWLYVDDHCRAIETVLLNGKIGETYCVGGQTKNTNNLEITKMVLEILGKNKDSIEYVKDRSGHDRKYAVDWAKINKELGWKPQFGIEKWLEKTVRWYKENEWWWRPLKKRAESIYKK
ncbi:dTDP-glucose 4,6-dehydratase [Candidatus Gottesmanbacteria bacterium]|nr:dTDP-glucose 4,6-dehydratase [Candidatus Gottesmanbacteria bacterium]